jgi:hypothetical protein
MDCVASTRPVGCPPRPAQDLDYQRRLRARPLVQKAEVEVDLDETAAEAGSKSLREDRAGMDGVVNASGFL